MLPSPWHISWTHQYTTDYTSTLSLDFSNKHKQINKSKYIKLTYNTHK